MNYQQSCTSTKREGIRVEKFLEIWSQEVYFRRYEMTSYFTSFGHKELSYLILSDLLQYYVTSIIPIRNKTI